MASTYYILDPDWLAPTYKMEYDWGWIDKATVQSYVKLGYITGKGYKIITGEDYESYHE